MTSILAYRVLEQGTPCPRRLFPPRPTAVVSDEWWPRAPQPSL